MNSIAPEAFIHTAYSFRSLRTRDTDALADWLRTEGFTPEDAIHGTRHHLGSTDGTHALVYPSGITILYGETWEVLGAVIYTIVAQGCAHVVTFSTGGAA